MKGLVLTCLLVTLRDAVNKRSNKFHAAGIFLYRGRDEWRGGESRHQSHGESKVNAGTHPRKQLTLRLTPVSCVWVLHSLLLCYLSPRSARVPCARTASASCLSLVSPFFVLSPNTEPLVVPPSRDPFTGEENNNNNQRTAHVLLLSHNTSSSLISSFCVCERKREKCYSSR
jgi:hypothetical protein